MKILAKLILAAALLSSCNSIKPGLYEGEVEEWLKTDGEFPVEFYEFQKNGSFKHYELFCFITYYGEGTFDLKSDSIILKYITPKSIITSKNITDTTIYKRFEVKADSLLIDHKKFIWLRKKSSF
jgi:hypothetical protein